MRRNKSVICAIVGFVALSVSSLSFGMAHEHEIFDAIKRGDAKRVKEIIDKEFIDAKCVDYYNGETPFHYACNYGNEAIVKILLENEEIGSLLKDFKPYINAVDNIGKTSLNWVCYYSDIKIIKLLLDNGAKDSINIADKNGDTPLILACDNDSDTVVVRLLLGKACCEFGKSWIKEYINKANNNGETPLYWACRSNNLEMAKLLLESGAQESVNKAESEYGFTPLSFACYSDNPEMVQLLLEWGVNIDQGSFKKTQVNLQDPEGWAKAARILAMLNLTKRFDEWVKTGKFFDLTEEEKQNAELCKFADSLLKSERAKIIRETRPANIFSVKGAPKMNMEQLKKISDCRVKIQDQGHDEKDDVVILGKGEFEKKEKAWKERVEKEKEEKGEVKEEIAGQRKRNRDALERGDEDKDDGLPDHKREK